MTPHPVHGSDEELVPFRVPLRLRFRGVTERSGVLVCGPRGWGEWSPFPEYPPEVAARWLAAAREAAHHVLPPAVRHRVPVNTTIPAVAPEIAARLVRDSGCATAKVKVAERGQGPGDDLDRVAAVRDALGPTGRVRIDANGAWDVPTAVQMLERLDRYELEYAEQPVATLSEMAELRRRVRVPLAADESIRTAEDPLRVAGLDAADVVVVKVQPLGGVRRALDVVEAAGLPAVVSSAVETSVGLAMGLALAAALPELPFACGLGTATLLAGDVVDSPLLPVDGAIEVGRPEVDEAALAPWRLDGPPADALLERFAAAEMAGRGIEAGGAGAGSGPAGVRGAGGAG